MPKHANANPCAKKTCGSPEKDRAYQLNKRCVMMGEMIDQHPEWPWDGEAFDNDPAALMHKTERRHDYQGRYFHALARAEIIAVTAYRKAYGPLVG